MKTPSNGYEACTGCSLCLLPCPVWNETRDVALTLKGRARAWAAGALLAEIAPSLEACVVCGACEPVCPEDIDTVGVTLTLRREMGGLAREMRPARFSRPNPGPRAVRVVAGPALYADAAACDAVVRALGGPERAAIAQDSGHDVACAVEAGFPLDESRVERFVTSLRDATEVLLDDGILLRWLRARLPGIRVRGLGEALAERKPALRKDDLLVIESRAYHADWARLVSVYDALRVEAGCATNLDLQRCATPTGAGAVQNGAAAVDPVAQAKWILDGKKVARVVVERMEDAAPFRSLGLPVVHLGELLS